MKKRRSLTLLEIMVVLLLIALVAGIVGYNMKGSLDEGRYFKTNHAMKQLRDLLLLEVAKGATAAKVVEDPKLYLRRSGLAKDVDNLIVDGWGVPLQIRASDDGDIVVKATSPGFRKLHREKGHGEE